MLDGDGFDDYNGVGVSPGIQDQWTLTTSGGSGNNPVLSAGRFAVGQRVSFTTTTGSTGGKGLSRLFGAASATWTIGGMFKFTSALPTLTNVWACLSVYSAGTPHVGWKVDSNGAIIAYRLTASNAGVQLGQSANGVIILGQEHYIETTFTIDAAAGIVKVVVDGTVVLNLVAQNTKNAALATADQINIGYNTNGTVATHDNDDMYWRNDNTMLGDVRWEPLQPNADGATLNLVPSSGVSHFALVNEATVDVVGFLQGSAVGDLDELLLADLSSTPASIFAVKAIDWALKTDAGARSINVGVNSGGTISDGANLALLSTVHQFSQIMLTDPNTGAAWTPVAVNALKRRLRVAA